MTHADPKPSTSDSRYLLERVDDAAVVQLYAPGFDQLPLREKRLVWHLYEAALAGRDIYIDQRYAHGLRMRAFLEAILRHPEGVETAVLDEIRRYAKLFWINNGPFNNLTARKFVMRLRPEQLGGAARAAAAHGAAFPLRSGESLDELVEWLAPLYLDATRDRTVTAKTPPPGFDILTASANNLYRDVAVTDLAGFEETRPLTSRLVRRGRTLVEEPYAVDGRYGPYIQRIVGHLRAALPFASSATARALEALIRAYETGRPEDWHAYDVAWVADQSSVVDTINGFVEVYMDARGQKGAWEGLVYYVHPEKTEHIQKIAAHAQWFEDHMPWDAAYRRAHVTGVSAKAIEVVVEAGESAPVTPIGINLPNDQRVREAYGSKSVLLSNVVDAYDKSTPPEYWQEFSWSPEEAARAARWSALASELTTNMHEVIGHGSGKVADRLAGQPHVALKEQYSALEEARADLVALYFIADPVLVELDLVPAEHQDAIVRAEYEGYARNALAQLRRVREGTHLEEDHMRNRQMIVRWLLAHTAAVEERRRDGKTYYVVTDTAAFRAGVARLLAEVQRIKSEGDYSAAVALFDQFGIHFSPELRDEIVERVDALHLPSYTGFVQPKLTPVFDASGEIADVVISYPRDLTTQMLEYSERYAHPLVE